MEKLTYRQAFDKITEAYIRGEIKPMDTIFCFCGTLAGGRHWGGDIGKEFIRSEHNYSLREYGQMEFAVLSHLTGFGISRCGENCGDWSGGLDATEEGFEDFLFAGMSAALEVLKEIHRARGEDVDEVQPFTKRELLTPAH